MMNIILIIVRNNVENIILMEYTEDRAHCAIGLKIERRSPLLCLVSILFLQMRVFEAYKGKIYKFYGKGTDLSAVQSNDTIIM